MALLLVLVPPALAYGAHLLYPERRILTGDAVAWYFFGVVFALLAVALST